MLNVYNIKTSYIYTVTLTNKTVYRLDY